MQGRRFADRYELQSPLGRGGMAEVWRARDIRLDRAVAVKILDQVGAADPAAIERFRREAQAVARMAHPNIVAGYDLGEHDGRPYLVMELVSGETLDAKLDRGPLAVAEAVRFAAQACAALDAAHQAEVVHRDIKPGNLIVTPDGTVKVLDFGIARLQDAAGNLTRTATVVGTSAYMAPEQASGGTADPRTDLYALGCVLYAMLTGAPPFEGNPMAVLYQHLNATPRPVSERRPDVPEALDQLVAELLAKRPEDRPASASEVRGRLQGMSGVTSVMPVGRAAVPAAAPPATEEAAPARPALVPAGSWRRWPALLAVGFFALVVLGLAVLALLPDGERPAIGGASPQPEAAEQAGSPTPSPTPTATGPEGRLAEARKVFADLVAAGEIDADAERKIDEALDKIGDDLRKGEQHKAAEHVAELQRTLDELAGEYRISAEARHHLSEAVARLAEVLPAPGEDEDDDNPGRGNNGHGNGNDNKNDKDKDD